MAVGARVNMTDRVHAELREAIIAGRLKPNSMHSVYRVADELGVSRTPVREAVLRLADIGMVTIVRNRGFIVRGLTIGEIRDVFELRLIIEAPAAAYAATHGGPDLVERLRHSMASMQEATEAADVDRFMQHDLELHSQIAAVLGNRRMNDLLTSLRASTYARGALTVHHSRGLQEIQNEHAPIVDAMAAGDAVGAAMYMEAHIVRTGTLLMTQLSAATGEEVPLDWAARIRG